MTTTAMTRTMAAAAVAAALLACAPLAACSGGDDAPAADATGPVEATSIQDTPQDLLVGVLRLREQGKADQAARYFISHDYGYNDLDALTEVDASMLCTSSSADCTDVYSEYSNGKRCSETTSQEAQKAGVIDNRTERPVNTNPDKPNDRLVSAKVAGTGEADNCRFSMAQVGGKWWLVSG